MKRGRRLPQRLIRWTSLSVSIVLIITTIVLSSPETIASRKVQQGRERRMPAAPPAPSAPNGVFPNIDEAKRRRSAQPRIARQIESTVRSRRKPVESRRGLKVGDRLPTATPSPIAFPSPTPVRLPSSSSMSLNPTKESSLFESPLSVEVLLGRSGFRALHHSGLQFLSLSFSTPAPRTIGRRLSARTVLEGATDLFVPTAPQSGSSKIVYVSNRDGSMQIYVMNADGSGQYRLTSSGANDLCPRWSPNGTKILFESDRDNPMTGYLDIYVMNADGSGVTRLTTDPNDDGFASWSSDGSHIVFHSNRSGTN